LTPFEAHQLRQLASWIEDLADARSLQIIWLPPHTFNSDFTHEKLIGQLRLGPRAGADISVRVDTNGQVYPPRGPRVAVGTIDRTDWSEIWNHPCFRSFREMVRRTEHCSVCPLLTMCASYCPADEAGWTIED
jgi:radical SAM protein with 4Fe4S-binding SPASM domain